MAGTSLQEFLNFICQIDDDEILEVAEGLLRDIVEIERKKEEIQILEDGLSKGKRAIFWLDAMGLDREAIDLATNKVIGRRRFLSDQEEFKRAKEAPQEVDVDGSDSNGS